jgi:TRAP-type C4-dicarboxylate transport system permease small subunit
MNQASSISYKVCQITAQVGGALFLLSAIAISIDVALRNLTSISVGEANELSTYVLIVAGTMAFCIALLERVHIRIDVLYNWLPRRICIILDLLSISSIAGYAGILSWYATVFLVTSFQAGLRANTPMRTPLWIPVAVWDLALLAFCVVTLHLVVKSYRAYVRNDLNQVTQLIGTSGLAEELEKTRKEVLERTSK